MRKERKGKICCVNGCGRPAHSHADEEPACTKHYQRWKKHGTFQPDGGDTDLIYNKTRAYRSYRLMLSRCHNPKVKDYFRYGGRGVTVCDRWRFGEDGKHPFRCFYEDMGEAPVGHTLDRMDNNRGYSKNNCRWATSIEQARNQSNNYFPSGVDPHDVCEKHGVHYGTFRNRVARGETIEQALRSRQTKILEDGGKPLVAIAKETGVPYRTLADRWYAGCRGDDLLKKRPRYA